jgi:exopolyphosphatase/guanosine-5'-triphosphate,3'-diphosphate pyrophosphatase
VTRVAAVDLGTNTTRLLIADVEGELVGELVRRGVVTSLGEGVDATRTLHPDAIARVHTVLADFRREADALGIERSLAVATSAVRDASNGIDFLAGIAAFETRLLSGDEEAELTRRGIGRLDDDTLLLDVGGGSTELTLDEFRVSLDIGSVRLTERHLRHDPPLQEELEAAARQVREALPELAPGAAVGVAGTLWQLAELDALDREALERQLDRLAAVPLERRRELPNVDPDRAPAIVAGALIVREVLRAYGLPRIDYSVQDLLDGVALEAAKK